MCASHNGEPDHVRAVRRLLRAGGATESMLGARQRSRPAPRTPSGPAGHGASSTTARESTPGCSRPASVRAGPSRPTSSPATRSSARSFERCAGRRASTPRPSASTGVVSRSTACRSRRWRPCSRALPGRIGWVASSPRPPGRSPPCEHTRSWSPGPAGRDTQLMASVPGIVSKVGAEAIALRGGPRRGVRRGGEDRRRRRPGGRIGPRPGAVADRRHRRRGARSTLVRRATAGARRRAARG